MITEKAANAAIQPAQNNTDALRCLDVKDNTPMAQLIHACTTMVKNIKVDGQSANLADPISGPASAVVQDSMMTDVSGVSPHDVTMHEIVKVAKDSVSGMLNIARNVVRPMVRDVYEMVDERVTTHVGTPERHEVMTVFLEDAYNNPAIIGLIERYAETPVSEMRGGSSVFPELDGQELEETMLSGIGRVDEDLRTALVDMEGGFLLRAYNSVFRASGDNLYKSMDAQVNERTRRCAMLVTFFIARKFMESTPEGVGVPLSSFNAATATMLEQAGRFMYQTVQKRDKAISDKKLLAYFPPPNRKNEKIVVVGEVYNRFLEEGGSPELLMGACLSGDRSHTFDSLLVDRERYASFYERAEKLHSLKAGANKVTAMVDGTRDVLTVYINNIDSEKDTNVVYDKDTLRGRLNQCLSEGKVTESTECYTFVRDVVCKVFYPHTNAGRILSGIDALCKENPKMEPREAATLMVVDIVAEWIASMIDVDHYKPAK